MDTMFSKADSVRPFELGLRRLHTPDLLQIYKAHFSCKMYMELCMRGNPMHLLKNSWQFSFKITEKAMRISFEKPPFTCETHYVRKDVVYYNSSTSAA